MTGKITSYSPFTSVAPGDLLIGVDVDDITMAATGTDKKLTLGQLLAAYSIVYVQSSGDTSGATDTAAIQNALLSFGTLSGWAATGGVVLLSPGTFHTNKTLIIPSGVLLLGTGAKRSTVISLVTGSNCDMVQSSTYNSAAQAALLGVTAASIANAFYYGIGNLELHGDAFATTTAGYCHGINLTTNPLTATGTGDPDFDPMPVIRDVAIKACTGDGLFAAGRGGGLFIGVVAEYCNGNGLSPSFDTTLVDCLANSCNIAGFYMNHFSDCGTGCKSYLTGNAALGAWVSGHSYSPGNTVLSAGILYFNILATSGTTAPASDAAHWTALPGATSPQAFGAGFYFDSNAGEQNWSACDGQQNLSSDFYLAGTKGNTICGSSNNLNYPNTANPNGYASVVFNGASGNTVIVNSTNQATGLTALCAMTGSNSANTLIASTDGTQATLFSSGYPALAMVNGKIYTGTGLPVTGALITMPATLTFGASIAVNAAAANDFLLTLTASTGTIANPSNPPAAGIQIIRFHITQDATGSRTVAWGSAYDFGASGTPTLSTGASKVDIIGFVYNSALAKCCFLGAALGN